MNARIHQQALPMSMKNVSYTTQGVTLIHNFNLMIDSPGNSIVLGHNGAGKSLLLQLLHGVIKPIKGEISWHKQAPHIQQYWRTLLLQRPTFLINR